MYFSTTEQNYIDLVTEANTWLMPPVANNPQSVPVPDIGSKIAESLKKPPMTIDCFSGDPLLYARYMQLF